ncbi:hypothetical protein TIFTF001_004953 [Ficus carica]|uniref:Uncharacterized protein n=1 Tax=Ficus carica TaxID=3494 RepID=A0AA87ZKB7_FICCA|nr:hypothetical protein TIFTF001_004953 [Ficus carica]
MAEVVRSSSDGSFWKSSWKPPLRKTKSRLLDPVKEPRQKSERIGSWPSYASSVGLFKTASGRGLCCLRGTASLIKGSREDQEQDLALCNQDLGLFSGGSFQSVCDQDAFWSSNILRETSHERQERAFAEVRDFQSAGAAMPSELKETLLPRNNCPSSPSCVKRSPTFSRHASERHDKKIPIDYLHKMNPKNISAWNVRRMITTIRNGSLTTLEERILNSDTDDESSLQIKTECQAKEAERKIFFRVAKPGSQYIFLEDLMHFMSKDEAMRTMHLFGTAAEKGISKSAQKDWARGALALSLNATKTAVDELHNMLNILVGIII